jgi:hypothetical protein
MTGRVQIIGPVLPLHTGTESLQTRRWSEPDSNRRSRSWKGLLLAGHPGRRHENQKPVKVRSETQMAPPGALSQPFRFRWDHEFESVFLQQPVCLSGERRGCTGKAPHSGGILREAGDVRRDAQAANQDSFALSL